MCQVGAYDYTIVVAYVRRCPVPEVFERGRTARSRSFRRL